MTIERRPPSLDSRSLDSRSLDSRSLATLCARAGQGTRDGEPLVLPIVQSTTFFQDGIFHDHNEGETL